MINDHDFYQEAWELVADYIGPSATTSVADEAAHVEGAVLPRLLDIISTLMQQRDRLAAASETAHTVDKRV